MYNGAKMDKDTIEQFVINSKRVGNANTIISKNEFLASFMQDDYEYVYIPAFNYYKKILIDKNGIEKAIVESNLAIAETGTVVIDNNDETLRRATSLAEELNIVVLSSSIVSFLEDSNELLNNLTKKDHAYITFITGASRTADIELVLAMGVHGPLRVNIIIITDA
jgi:L-lactate dehydrogenase complex protein LldG